uniref:RING-type domain-containing protein n=1 Tax=Kalanchoe fedtschenkoi TaxID=63787 RepID=A0A7N1A176_KALFE
MSRNRRFLAESPRPPFMSDHDCNNHTWPTVMYTCMLFILILLILTLIYNLIRRRSATAQSQPRSGCCSHDHMQLQLQALPVNVHEGRTSEEEAVCAVCLGEYERGERLRLLPCRHVFHCACIDPWLRESGVCPVCRRVAVDKELIRVENAQRCSERLMATTNIRTVMGTAQLI